MKIDRRLLPPLFFILLALLAFRAALPGDQIIQSSDTNIGVISWYKRIFPTDWFAGSWIASGLLGTAASRPLNLTNLLISILPVTVSADWLYAVHLTLSSLAFTAFLRRRGVGTPAALFGSLTAFWLASNLTLVYPGHLHKYGVVTGCALFLWLWEVALASRRAGAFLAAGAAFGLMFLEQQDLAVFAAVLAAPHALWRVWSTRADATSTAARWGFLAAALPALLLMSDAYFKARTSFIDPVSQTQRSAEDTWGWATQWSWPPAETIDFIAPGYHGLRSGEPGAEYWGEMGRSPGWETTGQGFRNFKLESQYLGMLPVGFALLGLVLAFAPFARAAPGRADLRFWAIATLVLLVLSCGKYLPLYRLFFELPLMSSIRNPNKFLQVFQIALGVLAARGFDAVLGSARAAGGPLSGPRGRRVAWAAAGVSLVLMLAWMTTQTSAGSLAAKLASQRYGKTDELAALAVSAMGHAFAMSLALAAVLWTSLASRLAGNATWRGRLAAACLALVVLDVHLLAGKFLVAQPLGNIRDNPVALFLKREAAGARVHAPDQSGIYGHLLTYVLPFEGVDYANMLAAPRMRSDLEEYLNAVGRNLPRMWDHFGVTHVLLPRETWERLRANPTLGARLEPVMGWGLVPDPKSGFRFVEMKDKPQHVVLRLRDAPGRVRVVGAWKEASREAIIQALAAPGEDMEKMPWVEKVEGQPLPSPGAPGPAGKATQQRGIPDVRVRVEAERPGLLVLADLLTNRFEATLNGQPIPLRRVNHLLMGVPVPAGTSEVVVRFVPPKGGIRAVLAGWTLGLAGALSLLVRGPRPPAGPAPA